MLQRYTRPLFTQLYINTSLHLSPQFNLIGNYWKKGHQNEIDIIAVNEREKFAVIAELKLSAKRIQLHELERNALSNGQLGGYKIVYKGLSLDDMNG